MFRMPKYWLLLISTLCVVGAAYSYQEQQVRLAFEGESIGSIARTDNLFWIFDAIGRYVGGILAYALVLKVNGYVFLIIYAACSLIGNIGVFVVIALDFDGGFWLLIPACNVGLAVGGYWVAVGQILIDDAGDKHYGMVWGMSLLFNFLGMFFFDLLIFLIELGVVAALLFVLLGIVAVLCAVFAYKDDKKI